MKKMLAWAIYMLGALFALRVLITGLADGSLYWLVGGVAFAVVLWWITVGIGVRLGVTPDDFAASIRSTLGFGHRNEEGARADLTDER